jgi:hypothetical protein
MVRKPQHHTYFIHGRLTRWGFHLIANILRQSPKGYFFIMLFNSDSIQHALRDLTGKLGLTPAETFDAEPEDGLQTSFIKERR